MLRSILLCVATSLLICASVSNHVWASYFKIGIIQDSSILIFDPSDELPLNIDLKVQYPFQAGLILFSISFPILSFNDIIWSRHV